MCGSIHRIAVTECSQMPFTPCCDFYSIKSTEESNGGVMGTMFELVERLIRSDSRWKVFFGSTESCTIAITTQSSLRCSIASGNLSNRNRVSSKENAFAEVIISSHLPYLLQSNKLLPSVWTFLSISYAFESKNYIRALRKHSFRTYSPYSRAHIIFNA